MGKGTVWVTGADGFAGRAAIDAFQANGWRVIALTRWSSPGGDLSDLGVLAGLSAQGPADAIVHLASRVDLRPDADAGDLYGSNVLAAAALADLARRWQARMVLASSIAVFGRQEFVTPATEPAPATPYARAKLAAEAVVAASGAHHAILRIGGIYGYGGPSHLGLNHALARAVDDGRPPSLTGPGNGRRNYVYVHDLADMIVGVVEGGVGGIHLVGGPEPIRLKDMLDALAETFCEDPVERKDGMDVPDCVVEPSPGLLPGRRFAETLEDIRCRHGSPRFRSPM
ncbi:MAG: NAD(P)-dependent oxidoreductase [Pseudomonadota bacterium]